MQGLAEVASHLMSSSTQCENQSLVEMGEHLAFPTVCGAVLLPAGCPGHKAGGIRKTSEG
jgi:hypothetical protein